MGILDIKDVGKRFGGLQALSDVTLNVEENTCHAILSLIHISSPRDS